MAATTRLAATACVVIFMCMRIDTAMGKDFDIQAGPADYTINEFSRQSDIQVLFDFNTTKTFTTHQVKGCLEPKEALELMLSDTGLTFSFVNDKTLYVTPMSDEPVDSATFYRWMRRFQYVAQTFAEGAGPALAPLTVEIVHTNEIHTASR
jgi:hypothetical protein